MTHLVGRTEGDEIVAFEGPRSLIGSITPVKAVGATPLTIQGQWCPEPNIEFPSSSIGAAAEFSSQES